MASYFKEIVTREMQPEFISAARFHQQALNEYLRRSDGSKREVEEITTVQTVLNGTIWTTSFLCCEEEEGEY